MPDVPGKPGDAFDPNDELRRDDDSDMDEDCEDTVSKRKQPEGIGEEAHYYPAAELLSGLDTSVVLERIMEGDPLGIRQRCAEQVRKRCYLLHFDSLYIGSMARVAYAGVRYRGQVPFDRWVGDRIDEAAEDQLQQELEAERTGVPSSEPWESHYTFIA